MKMFVILLLVSFILSSCNLIDTSQSEISPLSVRKIDKIKIAGKQISATINIETPTPCWNYLRTDKSQSDSTYTAEIFGKYNGDPCQDVLSSITQKETITFSSPGEKRLRFWVNDSTYLDTLINIK